MSKTDTKAIVTELLLKSDEKTLAKQLGVNWRTIRRWSRGETAPQSEWMVQRLYQQLQAA